MEQKVYIIVSNMRVEEMEMVKNGREYCIVGNRFFGSGIRIRRNRVYASKQEAEKHLPYRRRVEVARKHGIASPYDYEI